MAETVFTPSLEGMKHVKSVNGTMLTKPFLDVCKQILPLGDKFGAAMAIVKSDIGGNITRKKGNWLLQSPTGSIQCMPAWVDAVAAGNMAFLQHRLIKIRDGKKKVLKRACLEVRPENKYTSGPSKYEHLYSMVQEEVQNKTAKGSSSCTNGLLWLTRDMDFLVELFRNLLDHPDWTMSQACTDSYSKTLKKWHGWLASSSYTVGLFTLR
ncbi:hypothetical protein ACP70R_046068 [Stipagrostis hirtigluma subsp. patula]